jgi:hypothetical protein
LKSRQSSVEETIAMRNDALSGLLLLAPFALCCLFVLASEHVVAGENAGEATYARLQFVERAYDFGTLYQNEEVSHAFTFRNSGTGVLRIEKVKSSCGCTAALPEKRQLEPGDETTLAVTFRSGSMRDRVTKHIYVDTNDAVEPSTTLTITATVKVEVDISPRSVYIGDLRVGETAQRSVEIIPVSAKSFRVVDVSANDPAVQVREIVSPAKEGDSYKLTIEVGPVAKPGRVNAKILVRTDLAHTPEIAIPVYGKIAEAKALPPNA